MMNRKEVLAQALNDWLRYVPQVRFPKAMRGSLIEHLDVQLTLVDRNMTDEEWGLMLDKMRAHFAKSPEPRPRLGLASGTGGNVNVPTLTARGYGMGGGEGPTLTGHDGGEGRLTSNH